MPTEIWPIQEFTYLSPLKSAGTTAEQRRPRVQRYWDDANIHWQDGDGAESFAMFMARVLAAKNRLETLNPITVRHVVCVGHGQFWQALRAAMQGTIVKVDSEAMHHLHQLEKTQALANTSGFTAHWSESAWHGIAPA